MVFMACAPRACSVAVRAVAEVPDLKRTTTGCGSYFGPAFLSVGRGGGRCRTCLLDEIPGWAGSEAVEEVAAVTGTRALVTRAPAAAQRSSMVRFPPYLFRAVRYTPISGFGCWVLRPSCSRYQG